MLRKKHNTPYIPYFDTSIHSFGKRYIQTGRHIHKVIYGLAL